MKTNKTMLSKKQQIMKMVSMPAIVLEAGEANRFIDYIVDQSVLKNNARIVRMEKQTKNIRAMGIGQRFLHPETGFSSADYLKTLAENLIQLTSKKVRGCVAIHDDDLEDNVEADAFADHVMRMVAAKIANELDEAFWIGDTASFGGFAADDIRGLFDGWRYRIRNSQVAADAYYNTVSGRATLMTAANEAPWLHTTAAALNNIVQPTTPNGLVYIATVAGTTAVGAGNEPTWPTTIGSSVIDATVTWRCHAYDCTMGCTVGGLAGAAPTGSQIVEQASAVPYNWEFKYNNMLKKFPSKYKTVGLANLRFFNSDQVSQDYVSALAARSTVLGDAAVLGQAPMQFGKVPIIGAPLMVPTMSYNGVLGAGTHADCLLTTKNNLIVGIQRQLKIESQRVAADESTYWYYTMRVDVAIENVEACVLMEKLIIG